MLLVGAITAGRGVLSSLQFGSTTVLDERVKQTVEGNKSDEHRMDILVAALEIGLDNPMIGVSPQQLPFEIGRRICLHCESVSRSHNVLRTCSPPAA